MKKLFLTIFFIFCFVSCAFAISTDEIASQNKPVIVLFKADYCHACKNFEPVFDKVARKYCDAFLFVKEDANTSSLAKQFEIEYVPVVFVINPKTMTAYKIKYEDFYNTKSFENVLNKYKAQQ